MKKKSDYIITLLFICFIFGIAAANLCKKDAEYSEMENRMLAQRPEISLSGIVSGKFMEEYETYVTDQFVGRDAFVSMKSACERLLGKKINNGVYYAQDGYLIEQFSSADKELAYRNAEAIGKFAQDSSAEVMLALIPGSAQINRDKLDADAPEPDQKEMIENIYECAKEYGVGTVDMYDTLWEHREEELFYRTDHHWTSLGAYYGYLAYAQEAGITPLELGQYTETVRSEEFYGTLYSKAGAFWITPDRITTYVADENIEVEHIEGEVSVVSGLYDLEKLSGKDKYAMFLGGNQPLAVIRTSKQEQPKLLIIRDSFSDSLAPFLTEHYSEIYLWDFRYNRESVADFIKENQVEKVLICYSLDNFSEDTNIPFVLGR